MAVTAGVVALSACLTPVRPSRPGEDVARYILPPGNYGGLPTTDESRDQLPLYDGLTPLRGNVTDADIESHFLPEDFQPIGTTQEIATGRPGPAAALRRVRRRRTSTGRRAPTSPSAPAG